HLADKSILFFSGKGLSKSVHLCDKIYSRPPHTQIAKTVDCHILRSLSDVCYIVLTPTPNPQLLTPFVPACTVQILPPIPLLYDGLEVLLPDNTILHWIFDDRADQTGGYVTGAQPAIAEVRRKRQAAVDNRDRLGGRQRAAGRFDLGL